MLNLVALMGSLRESVADDTRLLEVERDYKNSEGQFTSDLLPVQYWSRSKTCTFMQIKNGARVVIKGRIELSQTQGIIIIAETFDYVSNNNFANNN